MSNLNHYEVSKIFGSEIVGKYAAGHGQIASAKDAQAFRQLASKPRKANVKSDLEASIVEAFLEVRSLRGDQRSPDLYIADFERNAEFIAACRRKNVELPVDAINRTLMRARKANRLKGLNSKRFRVSTDDACAFACEFAATRLRYERGASIDDILCDPELGARFEKIASSISPGFASLQLRWSILSIRKSGRHGNWKQEYSIPPWEGLGCLFGRKMDYGVPESDGVYMVSDVEKPLYIRATHDLFGAFRVHRDEKRLNAFAGQYCKPDPMNLNFRFARISARKMLLPVEVKLVTELQPIFNVQRAA